MEPALFQGALVFTLRESAACVESRLFPKAGQPQEMQAHENAIPASFS